MSTSAAWPCAAPPAVHGESSWTWVLHTRAELVLARTELFLRLQAPARSSVSLAAIDALLVAFDELAGNALTYVGGPVLTQIHRAPLVGPPPSWLVTVRDSAPQRPPTPTDPTDAGGCGLHLVHAVSADCGWIIVAPTKTVWALITMPSTLTSTSPTTLPETA